MTHAGHHAHQHGAPMVPRTGEAAPAADHGPHASGGHDGHAGPGKHAGHSIAMFRNRFWVALALTFPTLLWGHMLPGLLKYTPPHLPGAHLIPALFGSAVFLYGGTPFLQGAWRE